MSSVIFLDIDGVLISERFRDQFPDSVDEVHLCPEACSNLRKILEAVTSLRIVVSSSYRLGLSENELFEWLSSAAAIDRARFVSRTPHFPGKSRHHEIAAWLAKNASVTNWVILDDNPVHRPIHPRQLLVNSDVGLTERDALRAIKLLQRG